MVPVAVTVNELAAKIGLPPFSSQFSDNSAPPAAAAPEISYETLTATEQALAAIRSFRDDATLKAQYTATTANPYQDDCDIDIYDDEHGFEYWINPAVGRLIQAGPRAGLRPEAPAPGAGERLSVARLRELAVDLATRQVPDFVGRLSTFHPFEDNRQRQIYFFRWELGGGEAFDIPPFVQVGLHADGRLACFTNTLTEHVGHS